MATKKPSSKKSTKKSSNTSKKSTRKTKNQAPEIIDAKENQTTQPTDVSVADNSNNTQETLSQNSVAAVETNDVANITEAAPTTDISAPISAQEKNIHKDEVIVENASYNNLVVPNVKDNTYAFIVGGIVAILTVILFFL